MSEFTALLEREEVFTQESELKTEDQLWDQVFGKDLPSVAAIELGYTVLRDELQRKKEEASRANIVSTLAKLNIQPYTADSVERYKEEVVRDLIKRPILRRVGLTLLWAGGVGFVLSAVPALISLVLLIPGSIVAKLGWLTIPGEFGTIFSGLALTLVASVLLLLAGIAPATREHDLYRRYYWKKIPIKDYKKPIPDFALYTAMQIKRAMPDITIGICELTERKKRPWPDPFLYAEVEDKTFHLCVWDEPSFRGKRENESKGE